MIPIKIKNRKYKIKSISELTTKEFIELSKLEGMLGSDPMVSYIAWQTGVSFTDAFFIKLDRATELAIGNFPDILQLPKPKGFNYKSMIDTVGQRHQVESCRLEGYELLVFCLAVAQARSNNIDEVNALVEKYNDMPFMDILPAGFFFFRNLDNGQNSERRLLKRLLYSIKMLKLRNRRVFRG